MFRVGLVLGFGVVGDLFVFVWCCFSYCVCFGCFADWLDWWLVFGCLLLLGGVLYY